jgi:ketosteroid isomerase-like protein
MSEADRNRALVLRFYAAMSAQDFGAMFALTTPDATWTVAGDPASFHHAGTATRAQREAALANFTRTFASLEMDIRSTTCENDRVVVEAITRCATHTGLRYENELLVLIRCREGRIASIYEHLDQQTALKFDEQLRLEAGAAR